MPKDDLGYLEKRDELIAGILAEISYPQWTQDKKMAVESYLRIYLMRLTLPELEFMDKLLYDNVRHLYPDLQFKMDKASRGYDAFMRKRGKVLA